MSGAHPIVAVVQARMGSSRLPGKVLMPVAGKPLLWHSLHRLGQCRTVDAVAVATSTDARDDAIAQFCAEAGVTCIRGPLQNVLERYRLSAIQTGAQTLLRVTGDAPLIDPGLIDYMVYTMVKAEADYVQFESGALCAHEGVDVFSRRALDWLTSNAGEDEIAREHVTSYFKEFPGRVRTAYLPAYLPLARKPERISVDTPDDMAMLRAVYDRLGAPAGEASLSAVLKLLEREPDIRAITRLVPPSGNLVQGQSELPIDPQLAAEAAKIIAAIGYHRTIVLGLAVMGCGALLFVPAASVPSYGVFLFGLFVLASGMTLLQVSANPYVAVLGLPEHASVRLNLAQALNSLGTTIAPWLGGLLILTAAVDTSHMTPDQLQAHRVL